MNFLGVLWFIFSAIAIAYGLNMTIKEQSLFWGMYTICYTFWIGWITMKRIYEYDILENYVLKNDKKGDEDDRTE